MPNTIFRAIGIGEILWDLLPDGKKLGGAPANFAFHANQMGIHSGIISAIGQDAPGREIEDLIHDSHILNLIHKSDKPTGTVSVKLDQDGIPAYIIHEQVAWDFIDPSIEAFEFARNADAICFGTLAQRSEKSRQSIRKVIQETPYHAFRVFDINLRQQFYSGIIIEESLQLANVLKINEEEIIIFAELFNISGDEFEIVNTILNKFDLKYLALTKGAQGSWLIGSDEKSYLDTPKVTTVDTVGAGDSFTAAMVAGFLRHLPLKEIHRLAVEVSAFVCTCEGATPALPKDLIARLAR